MKAVEKNTGIGSSLFKLVRINDGDCFCTALFPKSTIKPQLPQPQVTVTLGAF